MSQLKRFTISLEKTLIKQFDDYIRRQNYPTRSKAVGELIQKALLEKEWTTARDIAGVMVLVYNHHKRDLVTRLTDIQHQFYQLIISSQHIHLDHNNCLEMIAVRGHYRLIKNLIEILHSVKGIKYLNFSPAISQ